MIKSCKEMKTSYDPIKINGREWSGSMFVDPPITNNNALWTFEERSWICPELVLRPDEFELIAQWKDFPLRVLRTQRPPRR